jgi:hypothetical protein
MKPDKRGVVFLYTRKKKGQYFEIDALIAIGILIVGLIYIRNLGTTTVDMTQNDQYSSESVKLVRNMRLGDLGADILAHYKNSSLSYYTNENYTVAKQIGIYYFMKNQTLAADLSKIVLESLIPSDYQYGVWIRKRKQRSLQI